MHVLYRFYCNLILVRVLSKFTVILFVFLAGNVKLARKILTEIDENVPGLAMITLRKASLERRHANFSSVEDLFKQQLDTNNKQSRSFYAIKFARYLTKVNVKCLICLVQGDLFDWDLFRLPGCHLVSLTITHLLSPSSVMV